MWIQCCVQNVSLKDKIKNVFEKMYNYTLIITAACSSDVDVLTRCAHVWKSERTV